MVRYPVIGTIVVALVASIAIMDRTHAAESTSPSYRLNPSTLNAGGAEVSSGSYVLNASASQRATIGTSSSPGFSCSAGKVIIGGGCNGPTARYGSVSESYPNTTTSWFCYSSYDLSTTHTAYAICARMGN